MFIGLFTVRVVLKTLGEEDYGIYAVVGGLLSFLTFISGALRTGSQRFFSYEMGRNNHENLRQLFGLTFLIYLALSIAIVVIGEFVGIWFINSHLNVSQDRIFAANVIFQFVIISTAFTLIFSPFSTAIMAHEDMGIFGKMAVVEAIFKVMICVLLVFSPWDKLISYSFLMVASALLVQSIYFTYAKRRYAECTLRPHWDKLKARELLSFSGWNLFGSLAWVVKNQGVSVVLNIFFGPIVNAAQGVALTVRTAISTFSNGFSQSLSPQIIKNYAQGNYSGLSLLLHRGSKVTFYLMLVVVVPIILNMDFVLQLWVGDHSNHMSTFCKLMLLEALIDSISLPLANANQATGQIATYQFLIGIFGLLSLPVAYVFLHYGYAPEWVFIISVGFQFFIIGVRILYLRRIYPGAVVGAIRYIVVPCTLVAILCFGICYMIHPQLIKYVGSIPAIAIYIIITCVVIWILGLNTCEKRKVGSLILRKIKG